MSKEQTPKPSETVMIILNRKFDEYMQNYGWQIPTDHKIWVKKFYEWGFTDGVLLGIDLAKEGDKKWIGNK